MSSGSSTLSQSNRRKLILAAIEAKENAYAPYSKFPVGAALLSPDGIIVKGCNVENASYGGTICAERTAMVKAVSDGIHCFIGLAVVTKLTTPVSPCGMCRQILREFCRGDMPILMVPSDYPQVLAPGEVLKPGCAKDGVKETTLGELLPDSFGPEHLERP